MHSRMSIHQQHSVAQYLMSKYWETNLCLENCGQNINISHKIWKGASEHWNKFDEGRVVFVLNKSFHNAEEWNSFHNAEEWNFERNSQEAWVEAATVDDSCLSSINVILSSVADPPERIRISWLKTRFDFNENWHRILVITLLIVNKDLSPVQKFLTNHIRSHSSFDAL